MPLDLTAATNERTTQEWYDLRISWDTTRPAGTTFQVYVDRVLAWYGRGTTAILPMPASWARIDVGAVADGEEATDFSSSLAGGGNRPLLKWYGGPALADDLVSYRVYRSPAAGQPVSYASPIEEIPATSDGDAYGGYGDGGYGEGGYGVGGVLVLWEGDALTPGTWQFAVTALDEAGNESSAATWTFTVAGPPRPPAPFADGKRLRYTYDPATRRATLTWNASP